jgi:hypothetical protein
VATMTIGSIARSARSSRDALDYRMLRIDAG